ncbi:MAG: TIGR00282 family metallophosphoesterase [Candidatus Aminicenantes bacterium]|nr:TIGR00282 family metallophosphoesterase [Candidatus Aminicenantes bacterium]
MPDKSEAETTGAAGPRPSFRVLIIGDVIGRAGRDALRRHLPVLRDRHRPAFVVANGENAAGGVGLTEEVGRELFSMVDVLTSGNHIWDKKEGIAYMEKEPRVIRPANYPSPAPGKGSVVVSGPDGFKLGVLNLQGRVFMEAIDDPFRKADAEIEELRKETPCLIVDFHAEATSEKVALGFYLDGRVSAVVGTHTHVPTADERILPGWTAYITDLGMAGSRNSVIGIRKEQAIQKFLTSRPIRFEPDKGGSFLSGVVVEIDPATGRALSIVREILIED